MNHEELTELINLISKTELEVIRSPNFSLIKNPDSLLSEMGIDSLEYMMLYLHIGEICGIKNEDFQLPSMQGDISLKFFIEFINKHKTKHLTFSEAKAEYLDDR